MPLDELHCKVAAIALRAAAEHGFALGSGNALIQHGVISRPTQDVDLFTDQATGVPTADGAAEVALRAALFGAERQDDAAGLAEIFPGRGEGLADGSSPRSAVSRWRCRWRTSTAPMRRWSWNWPGAGSGGRGRRQGLRAGQPGL